VFYRENRDPSEKTERERERESICESREKKKKKRGRSAALDLLFKAPKARKILS